MNYLLLTARICIIENVYFISFEKGGGAKNCLFETKNLKWHFQEVDSNGYNVKLIDFASRKQFSTVRIPRLYSVKSVTFVCITIFKFISWSNKS